MAVVLVLLDHLQLRHFPGGYVGVDVFFVISGYLIGASLLKEFRQGSFTLGAFYERRCRRILPALVVMIAVVSLLAYRNLMPSAFVNYAHSAVAALLSSSNIFFWHQAGYFDGPSASKPLLHTWSLAVEEQFYVFFPLLLVAIFRWVPMRVRTVLWTVAAVSFVLSVLMVDRHASTAFFWSPLRAWELVLGCMISQHAIPLLQNRIARETAAFAGLAIIAVPAILYTSSTPFPGLGAIPPCLGAALILAAGQAGSSMTSRLLSTTPFNFIGRISYSLYLWHWPFIVFQQTSMLVSTKALWARSVKIELAALSLVAATLSWRFVETPFRSGRFKPSRQTLFALSGAAVTILLFSAALVIRANGLAARFSSETRRVAAFSTYDARQDWRQGSCFLSEVNSFADYKPNDCLNQPPGKKLYLLYGDSIAAHLYSGLSQVFPEIYFQQATAAACPPTQSLIGVLPVYVPACRALGDVIEHAYLPAHHPDAVILAASWNDGHLPALAAEIKELQQQHLTVILVGPELQFDFPLPALLSTEMRRQDSPKVLGERISEHLYSTDILDRKMKLLAETEWKVRYISAFDTLCHDPPAPEPSTNQGCPLFTPQRDPIVFDAHHYSHSTSVLVAQTLRSRGQLP